MNRFLLTITAMAAAATSVSAVTVDDLDGLMVCQNFFGTPLSGMSGKVVEGRYGIFKKINDKQLRLSNFYECPAIFELNNDNLYLVGMDKSGQTSTNSYNETVTMKIVGGISYKTSYNFTHIDWPTPFYGKIKTLGNGIYGIAMNSYDTDYFAALQFSKRGTSTDLEALLSDCVYTFTGVNLYCMKPNAYIEYDMAGSDEPEVGHLYVTKEYSGNDVTYNLINIAGQGYHYYTLDGETVTVCISMPMTGNLSNGTVSFPAGMIAYRPSHKYNYSYDDYYKDYVFGVSHYYFDGIYNTSDKDLGVTDITGTYVPLKDARPVHTEADHNWTSQDKGNMKTTVKCGIHLNSWGVWNEFDEKYLFYNDNGSDLTDEIFQENIDYTHVAEFSNLTTVRNDGGSFLHITGKIAATKDDMYVDSYELYLVKGGHTSVAGKPEFNNKEHGHDNALQLKDYEKVIATTKATTGNADRDFVVIVPYSVLKEKLGGESSDKYSIYAKAVYKNDTQLEPTFHAITPLDNSIITAIDDVYGDTNADAPVEYYNLNGMKVENPENGGVYLRRQGSKVEKVVKL